MLPGHEIEILKIKLQRDITASIVEFMSKSGIYISNIDIDMINISRINGKAEYAVGNITIKMEI